MFRRRRGYEVVPSAEVDRVRAEVFGPPLEARGFEQTARRRWVRSTKAPIREDVGIGALKGAQLEPGWGISLDFVPHVTTTGRVAWHRTAKGARVDLGVSPLDAPARGRPAAVLIDTLRGVDEVRRTAERSARATIARAEEWFGRITDVASLVPLYEEAEAAPVERLGFAHFPQHQLSYAFVLARVGRTDEARARLDRWCATQLDEHTEHRRALIADELHERLADAGP